MTKILVLGATGYIGFAVASALSRTGHQVIGQTRDTAKNGPRLQQAEIKPLGRDPSADDNWLDVITSVDAVIDCIGGSAPLPDLCKAMIKKAEDQCSRRHSTMPKLVYIWTSGYLLHNDDRFSVQSERTAIFNPPSKVSWRPAVEEQLTNSSILSGIVIRPPLIYGGSGSITALVFKQTLSEDPISWPGSPGLRWPTAHIEDVAKAFCLALNKSDLVKGLIIDIANPATESIDCFLSHLCAYVGRDPTSWSYRPAKTPIEEALSRTVIIRSDRATHLLGWHPEKQGLIDGLPSYYDTFKSFQ